MGLRPSSRRTLRSAFGVTNPFISLSVGSVCPCLCVSRGVHGHVHMSLSQRLVLQAWQQMLSPAEHLTSAGAWLLFLLLFEIRAHYIDQAGLNRHPPASAS